MLVSVSFLKEVNQIIQLKVDDMDFNFRIVEEMEWAPDDSPGGESDQSDEEDASQWSRDDGMLPSRGPAEAVVNTGKIDHADKENLMSETVQLTRDTGFENNDLDGDMEKSVGP